MDIIGDIEAVVLCGGLGTRLRSAVPDVPKVLAEVNGVPFMDVILAHLLHQGFRRVLLCTGYQAESVEKRYRGGYKGLKVSFSREDEPLGTGGALKHAQKYIKSDPFVMLNGDSFCRVHFDELLKTHRAKHAEGTIVISTVKDSRDYGQVVMDSETGAIIGFKEKDAAGSSSSGKKFFVNAGVYCFNRSVFGLMPDAKKFSLEKDLFPKMTDGKLYGCMTTESFLDIGTPERYLNAQNKGTA